MLITETISINNKHYLHNYSDAGFKISRDGVLYDDALDPIDSGRTYTETDVPVPVDDEEEH